MSRRTDSGDIRARVESARGYVFGLDAGPAGFAALPPERRPQLSFAGVADLKEYVAGLA
jgi:phenylpropionate dioxygenase-like ring-hydroxylating dioxygenase large terminal subunit